ncbi:protein moonraker-like isoform X2 [Antedon mediterranea]|uniref:protein moonraker-like isoform X2 n=1 Tax=Antedon mediterranea TaxID=105859 RepID=UPI003AF70988
MQGSTRGISSQYNQLFFNLNQPPINTKNASIKFNKPGPIIVEKLTDTQPEKLDRPKNDQPQPIKMSAVSREQLSIAVQLAKRDIGQRRFSKDYDLENWQGTPKKSVKKTKKKGTSKKEMTTDRTDGKGESKNNIKQNPAVFTSRSHATGSKGYILDTNRNAKNIVRERPDRERPRPRTIERSSPESVARDQDNRQSQEIRRLRKELSHYIHKIESLSRKGLSPVKDSHGIDHQELDEVEARRKQARAAEQASRSARLLYSLQQQVREIKDDLDRIGPSQIRHTKKSRALNRLAAAHRGAVRALQTFIQQLPSQGETAPSSQPPMYQELALLIQQLSLCCSQMEIGGNGVPDDILDILQEAVEFQNNAEEMKPKVPLHSNSQKTHYKKKTSQIQNKAITRKKRVTSSSPYINKELPVRDIESARKSEETSVIRGDNAHENRLQEEHDFSEVSERDYALRARLNALIKAKDIQKQTAAGHARTSNPPRAYKSNKTTRKTGVLLPHKSKRLKKNVIEQQKQTVDDVHFTSSTIASNLKKREAVKPPSNPLPPWSPGGVPRIMDANLEDSVSDISPLNSPRVSPRTSPQHNSRLSPKQSPRPSPRRGNARRKVHFEEESNGEFNHLMSGFVEKEVARQAWLDKEAEKKTSEIDTLRSKEIDMLTAKVIKEAEEAVRKKVQPLIEHPAQQPGEKLNFDSETDDALVNETEKLKRIEDEIVMEERALDMQEEPTLEKLLQRLEEMETEEDVIRRRLQQITYSSFDDDSVKHKENKYEDECDLLDLKGTPLEGSQLERVADEIVNELLDGVSDEIGSMTEGFVENVYKREFGE